MIEAIQKVDPYRNALFYREQFSIFLEIIKSHAIMGRACDYLGCFIVRFPDVG